MDDLASLITAIAGAAYIAIIGAVILKEVFHIDLAAEVKAWLAEMRERRDTDELARRLLDW